MRTDLAVLHAALDLFAEHGFHATTMRQIAQRAGVSPGLAYKYHPSKEALAMALYARIAEQFEAIAPDLPRGTVAERFDAAMRAKLALITPHRLALRALAAKALDPEDRLGVLGPRTASVRARNSGVFSLVVDGASDRPYPLDERERLTRMLYGAHLGLIALWTQDSTPDNARTIAGLQLLVDTLPMLPVLQMMGGALLDRADALFSSMLTPVQGDEAVVDAILDRIFQRRRLLEPGCPTTSAAVALHRPRIAGAVAAGEPVKLVLPAFPAKSPNRQKTLGPLPDLAETLALRNLQGLCDEIAAVHPPGAELVIASDGHVFADLVEVPDADVDAYQNAIRHIVHDESLKSISLFDLGDVMGGDRGDAARSALVDRYARSIEWLKQRAADHPRHQAMFDGIHRFLFEDAVVLHPDASRTANRKATKARAWEVIRRSEAWGALVAEVFPDAVRLSIHPQPEVSEKIGVHLLDTEDAWLTPWHAVAVVSADGARLAHRHVAESDGAVVRDGFLELL